MKYRAREGGHFLMAWRKSVAGCGGSDG